MRRYISFPRIEGTASRQAHTGLPAGTYEREFGKEGFFGPATMLYHRHPPTGWSAFEGPLQPRAFDLLALPAAQTSPWLAADVLANASLRVRIWQLTSSMPALARNADGDDLLFFHSGAGELFCDFGHLTVAAGDYVVIPRSTMWRIDIREPITALLVETSNSSYQLPEKGLLGQHAIFDPGMLDAPRIDDAFRAQQSDSREWRVEVKRCGTTSVITYPFNPLDAIGWQGDLSVVRINVRDIRPLMSHRYHLPPSAHTTFVAHRFVICTFVPRPFETADDAIKVPFFHNNNDYDEVIFYHSGNFFSRDNIRPGMLTLHPAGFTHGPHPKALANMLKQSKSGTDEVAVMIDARDPLQVCATALAAEAADYVHSWQPKP